MPPFNCLAPLPSLEEHHLLEASAGTGKTFAIEHLVTRLLIDQVPIEQILVVTFTRAATRELKTRIRQTILQTIETLQTKTPSPPYLAALFDKGEETVANALLCLHKSFTSIDQAPIFTIHGFCQQMLLQFPLEACFSLPRSKERRTDAYLMRREIEDFLHTSLESSQFSLSQIHQVIRLFQGKVEKLLDKLATLVETRSYFPSLPSFSQSHEQFCNILSQEKPLHVETLLLLSPYFYKLTDRKGELKPLFLSQVEAFHPSCSKEQFDQLLQEKERFIDYFVQENLKKKKKEGLPPQVDHFFSLEQKITPILARAKKPLHTLLRLAAAFQEERFGKQERDFKWSPDQLLYHMRTSLSSSLFTEKVRSQYRALIIDEFQDTDPMQWEIFHHLFLQKPIPTLYAVGDPKQAIYSFRDADLQTYFQAAKIISKKSSLEINYRADPALIKSLNLLFGENPHWLALPNAPLSCPPVLPPPTAQHTPFPDKKGALHFLLMDPALSQEEMEEKFLFPELSREITYLKETGGLSFGEMAFLIKDRYQGKRLISFFKKHGIPYLAKSTEKLPETNSYTLWTCLLLAILHPNQPEKVSTLLSHPLFPATDRELRFPSFLSHARSLLCELHHLFHHQGFSAMAARLCNQKWNENLPFETTLLMQGGLEAMSDFRQIVELLSTYAAKKQLSLPHLLGFLRQIEKWVPSHEIVRKPLQETEGVTISTMHMSKGLEFPVVFAIGLLSSQPTKNRLLRKERKWFPLDSSNPQCEEFLLEEQGEILRQVYVTLTRAKRRVYIPVHLDPKTTPIPSLSSSPLEHFLSKLPPLEELLPKISATSSVVSSIPFSLPSSPSPSLLPPRSFSRSFPSHPLSSFSRLASSHESANRSPLSKKNPKGDEIPASAETGTILHALLETAIDQEWTKKPEGIPFLLAQFLKKTPLKGWEKEIYQILDAVYTIPLGNFSLQQILPAHLFTEVEFFFTQKERSMRGTIDLIVYFDHLYYLIDWKSNHLPEYTQDSLSLAMEEHSYFLQGQLYAQALQSHLSHVPNPSSIGGMFYVFLRGLPNREGVYFLSPKELQLAHP